MGENNSKIFLVAIIAIVVIILISNNFNDLTGSAVSTRGSPGSWTYCSYIPLYNRDWICGSGQGDCDKDADCESGLKCIRDVGHNYGWSRTVDVCEGVVTSVSKPAVSKPVTQPVIQSCTNECTPGERKCTSGSTFMQCVNDYDTDLCYEWESFRCASGQMCQKDSGKCVTASTTVAKCTVGGYRCEKDSSGKYTGWVQKCSDALKGWENVEYCKSGCDGNTGQCKIEIKTDTTVYGGEYEEVALGSSFVESLADDNGVLKTYEGLKVETSLTAQEDDYQTDVVLEVAKDSIKYYSNIKYPLPGKTFYFLGNSIKVESARADSMVAQINGIRKTIKDGDAFIGENSDKPKWVWDLNGLISGNPSIAIENDFIWNDDSDNPAKVGECIYLPNNYAKICLDETNIKYDADYHTYTIEYESSADLSEAGGGASEKTIHIHTTKYNGIKLISGIYTSQLWISGDGSIYYKDMSTNKVKYWQKATQLNMVGIINDDLKLFVNQYTENINIGVKPIDLREALLMKFSIVNGNVFSLGKIDSWEEADELTWEFNGKITSIGTKDEDHRTAYGIIVRDPKSHGASDEVVLDIPPKQVKAIVSMSFNAATTPPQPTAKCTDSDGGINYYVAGQACLGGTCSTEGCHQDGTLTETYCENNEIKSKIYNCPNGCSNGACVKEIIKSDFNSDGCVDFSDFVLFNHFYGKKIGDSEYNSKYDLKSDGKIDNSDFVLFAADYGKGCP